MIMKNITLSKNFDNTTEFYVCLGNGKKMLFHNKRKATAFVADTNRFLTKCLVILNTTYANLFDEYRSFWLVASNSKGGNTRSNYTAIAAEVKHNLDAAGEQFEKFNLHYKSGADPYFSFIDLKKICWFLTTAADALTKIHKKRNHTANYYNCMVLAERCQLIEEKLLHYGD